MAEPEKEDVEEEVRELRAKIERLERKLKEEGKEEEEGIAGSLLQEVGGMFGLGGLLKGVERSPAFRDRLRAIDEEVERRFREEPLKRTGEGRGRRGPQITSSFSVRTLAGRESAPPRARPKRRVKREVVRPEEPAVDIFEEPDHLLVIAELPGVEEEDINLDLQGDKLTISANAPHRRYRKQVTLPYPPQGDLKTAYKNGMLEIRLEKAEAHD